MREIETDYLVVGAGASGMAFVDALITNADVDVVMVDRRHRPGGHWLDAYPFVRLHQPSANYGVTSRSLGQDRIDATGPNAGFYERATAPEICDYYARVLDEQFLASGQVRFFGMADYRGNGSDGHRFVSMLTGRETTVRVRRKLVDATYMESSIPSRHTPGFEVDDGARVIPPNDLVDLDGEASGFTVVGAGKTAMDTCCWLLEQGVDPDRIRWIRPRDAWAMDRAGFQPLALVAAGVETQSRWVEAAAELTSPAELAPRLEAHGVLTRIDPGAETDLFRGAILSAGERDALRQIENVVRMGRVRRIGPEEVTLERGSIPSDATHVYVDCTAAGLPATQRRPIFERNRITLQAITLGVTPWSGAVLGFMEATRDDDEDKNRLCPPLTFDGSMSRFVRPLHTGLQGQALRMADPDVNAWNIACRLNPFGAAMDHVDDPKVQESLARLMLNMQPAIENLGKLVGPVAAGDRS